MLIKLNNVISKSNRLIQEVTSVQIKKCKLESIGFVTLDEQIKKLDVKRNWRACKSRWMDPERGWIL